MRMIKCVFGFGVLCTALTVAGCANPPGAQECGSGSGSGIVCPAGTQCSGDHLVCIIGNCGNGVLDPDEKCDDGNISDGDGCSADCNSDETCGNGIVDRAVGEICDDGNTIDGDACSHCAYGNGCGNGIVDKDDQGNPLEECDDGNVDNNDDCRNDCVVNRCGDGVRDANGTHKEDCDPAPKSTILGDRTIHPTETAECNWDCTFAKCGDAKVNRTAGEGCDDGANNADSRDCTASCKDNVCGDGLHDTLGPNRIEACDDGNSINDDGCSNTCTLPRCGNGIKDQGEQCDDGNQVSGDGCSSTCVFERCGDGIVNDGEQCDDAGESARCNIDCTFRSCDDGKVNKKAGEECDDGANNANDRDCTASCRKNVCGDGLRDVSGPNHFEECDDGNPINGDGCSNSCTTPTCGNNVVDQGEECDDGNAIDTDACNHCFNARCGDGVVREGVEECDDGPDNGTSSSHCSTTCRTQVCGNGIKDPGEQCDDGNTQPGDGCSPSCHFENCGDGVVTPPEQCDPGAAGETPSCNRDCTIQRCGDGKVNVAAGEACDDGNLVQTDDCLNTCRFNVCGDGFPDALGPKHIEACDDGNAVNDDGCSNSCTLPRCGNGIKDQSEDCDDGNTKDGDGCSALCKREFCGDGILNDGEACDRALTPATCNIDCTVSVCGDGKLNASAVPPEQCDDDNTVDGDGCSSTCKFERCGNGIVDAGEQCDGAAGLQPCSASCHQEICGNGILDRDAHVTPAIDEECDDGNIKDGDGCSALCRREFCGDGIVNNGEACDRALTPATCNLDCTVSSCGDGKLNTSTVPPEQCDDDNNTDGDGCSSVCQFERCGNGIVDPGEGCDDGNTSCGACSANCTAETSAPATGSLVVPAGNRFHTGDTFVLSDGVTVAIFEFTVSATPVAAVDIIPIPIATAATSDVIAADIAAAINLSGLRITATVGARGINTPVTLVHRDPTSNGNQLIASSFVDPSFHVSGMAGGQGGNCAAGQVCKRGIDCASQVCSSGVCQ